MAPSALYSQGSTIQLYQIISGFLEQKITGPASEDIANLFLDSPLYELVQRYAQYQ